MDRPESVDRAFVAVRPSEAALDAIAGRVGPLRELAPELRWTPRGQWHVTLRFLGRVDDLPALGKALRVLADLPSFPAQLGGGGAFPSPRRARVLWLGLASGGDELTSCAAAISGAIEPLGWAAEERPFHPHVTIARAPRPRDRRALVEAIGDEAVGTAWTVDRVVLYRSRTLPDGAVHDEVDAVDLRSRGTG